MSDRFPYNMPSRAALVELVRRSENKPDLKDNFVTFEDIFYSPTQLEPGRTYIEMINLETQFKDWFVYRRLDLADQRCLGTNLNIKIMGDPTPEAIALEINRSMNMTFGPDDISFSQELIPTVASKFEYELAAMTGSYAYYGKTKIQVEVLAHSRLTRYLENGRIRYLQNGIARERER